METTRTTTFLRGRIQPDIDGFLVRGKPLTTITDSTSGEVIVDETVGLPELTGSDKQITWAQDIRRKLLGQAGDTIYASRNQGLSTGRSEAEVDESMAPIYAAVEQIANQSEARWWIDSRHSTARELLRNAAQQGHAQ